MASLKNEKYALPLSSINETNRTHCLLLIVEFVREAQCFEFPSTPTEIRLIFIVVKELHLLFAFFVKHRTNSRDRRRWQPAGGGKSRERHMRRAG